MNKVTIYYINEKDVTIDIHNKDTIVIRDYLSSDEFLREDNIRVFASLIKSNIISREQLLSLINSSGNTYKSSKYVRDGMSLENILQTKYGRYTIRRINEDYLNNLHPAIISTRNNVPIVTVKKLIKYWDSLPSRKDNVESNK
jgi:hypothetical protein